MADLAAFALLLGEDWRAILEPSDDTDDVLRETVLQRAVDLQHDRDRKLAVMIANAMGGARSVDGRRTGGNTTSTA